MLLYLCAFCHTADQDFARWADLLEFAHQHGINVPATAQECPPLCVGDTIAFNWGYCWSLGVIVRPALRRDRPLYKWVVKYGEAEYRQALATTDYGGGCDTPVGSWITVTYEQETQP